MTQPSTPFELLTAIVDAGETPKSTARACGVHETVMRRLVGRAEGPVEPGSAKPVADHFGVKVSQLIDPETLIPYAQSKATA